MPFEAQTGVVDKLLDACEVAGFNEEKRIKYDNEKMSEIDYFYEMDCERAEGRAEGRATAWCRHRSCCDTFLSPPANRLFASAVVGDATYYYRRQSPP